MAEVRPGMPYPNVGLNEDYIETPSTTKHGFIVPVTREAIFFDRTHLILHLRSRGGRSPGAEQGEAAAGPGAGPDEQLQVAYTFNPLNSKPQRPARPPGRFPGPQTPAGRPCPPPACRIPRGPPPGARRAGPELGEDDDVEHILFR